ncbi:CHASE2 domain-containing protein [Novosphingobium sp. B1]|uniref:CHASE2 domain-containing protein n=1 Tax=Novosphingobium sp. B1 TaxID=1938756 RepID=UPI0009D903C3|nr:CHASE2 domain-containing protein [Novosphingobium sp. B1]SMC75493.1 sensor domain CHASE2-containing protein [Novosphingobium sp. B1]
MLRRRLYGEWIVVMLIAAAVAWFGTGNDRIAQFDDRLFDLASQLVAPPVDERILIVEIDEASLEALGRWPWPRDDHARLLDVLARNRPLAVGYSVLFLDPSPQDEALARSLHRAGNVYLAAINGHSESAGGAMQLPTPQLSSAAAGLGSVDLAADEDGVVRRIPPTTDAPGALVPLYRQLARAGGLRDAQQSGQLIAYAQPGRFRRISFAALASGEVPAASVRRKLLLVGATAAGLASQQPVPSHAGGLLSGVEVEANMLNTLLSQAGVRALPSPVMAWLAMLPALLLMGGFLRLSPSASSWLAAGLALALVAACLVLLAGFQLWFAPSGALLGLAAAYVLWGWRRLTIIGRFVVARVRSLEDEPGLMLGTSPAHGGDLVGRDASRLEDLIEQLLTLRRFVSEAIDHLPAAICVIDGERRIVLANRAAIGLFGPGIVGQPAALLAESLSAVPDAEHGLLRDGAGNFHLAAEAELPGRLRILSYADVTELQRIAEERDDILQFLSHDIRSPNAAIVTLLETENLAGRSGTAPPAAMLEAIHLHARHALKLADDFVQLARARRRVMEPEALDLCDVAREAADMVWPRAHAKGLKVTDRCEDGEIWVMGDRSMILRAAINLLENAVKFAPQDSSGVTFGVSQQHDCAVLSVSGTGPAMPPGRAAAPFALYAQGRDADGTASLGLGLAFVQTVAARHGGRTGYEYLGSGRDDEDGIALFSLALPLAQTEEEAAR